MRIPRYWARADASAVRPDGRTLSVMAWGWSEQSRVEAHSHARQRLDAVVDRVRQGLELPRGYAYGSRPLREEILDRIVGPGGDIAALVTRNSYGSLVLNTAQTMFVDVDLPETRLGDRLGGWFRRQRGSEEAKLDRLREALRQESALSARIYRTAAGFRVLVTNRLFAPASPQAERLMKALGADPAFLQLCRVQESFRARLTPKPWRCGQRPPPGQFPREDAGAQEAFADWLAGYERATESRATCAFVGEVGGAGVHWTVAPILRLHDERTGVESKRRLA